MLFCPLNFLEKLRRECIIQINGRPAKRKHLSEIVDQILYFDNIDYYPHLLCVQLIQDRKGALKARCSVNNTMVPKLLPYVRCRLNEQQVINIYINIYTCTIAIHLETVPYQSIFDGFIIHGQLFLDAPKITFAQSNNVPYHIVPIVSFILEVAVVEVISKAISSPPSSLLL